MTSAAVQSQTPSSEKPLGTFEEALSELEKIVRQLESGTADLQSSIDAYERGMALKKHCEKRLQEAQMRIEKITVGTDGKITTTALPQGE